MVQVQEVVKRVETMPEYIRVKNRMLDFLDRALDAMTAMAELRYVAELRKTGEAENAYKAAKGRAASALFALYGYLRPKIRGGGKFPKHLYALQRMEFYVWAKKPLSDLAGSPEYMSVAMALMRQYLEEIKLTDITTAKLDPWQELQRTITNRRRG